MRDPLVNYITLIMKILLLPQRMFTCYFSTNNIFPAGFHFLKAFGLMLLLAGPAMAQRSAGPKPKSDFSELDFRKGEIYGGLDPASEIVEKRGQYAKHFRNADGTCTAILTPGASLHYKQNGAWKAIDRKILPNHTGRHAQHPYLNDRNSFASFYPAQANGGVITEYREGVVTDGLNRKLLWMDQDHAVLAQVSLHASQAQVSEHKVAYPNVAPGIDLVYYQGNDGRKMDYVLNSSAILDNIPAQARYLAFAEDFILPQGCQVVDEKNADDQVMALSVFVGSTFVFRYDLPKHRDSEGKEIHSYYRMAQNTLYTIVDIDWLRSGLTFPVCIDPSVTVYPTASGNYNTGCIDATYAKTTNNDIYVGMRYAYGLSSGSRRFMRAWASFDVSSIPDNATISNVVFGCYIGLNSFYAPDGQYARVVPVTSGIPNAQTGATLYNMCNENVASQLFSINPGGTGNASLDITAVVSGFVASSLSADIFSLGIAPVGTYSTSYTEQVGIYGSIRTQATSNGKPYLTITYAIPVSMTCATLTNLAASLGSPFNGTTHHIGLGWNALAGATGYDVQYSTDGSSYSNASPASVTTNSYSFNAGDSPNVRYWFRIRAKDASQTCDWTYAGPIYTAADVPEVPLLTHAVGTSLDLALQSEAPVVNPAVTTYSIVCSTTGQFVQADGSLGATEVFRTKAVWGTVHVHGLTPDTEYCFYARAKNGDGHVVNGGTNISATEIFASNTNFNAQSGSGPANKWWTPGSPGSGSPMVYTASGSSCGGDGYVGFSGSFTNFFGSFLRSPQQNCSGLNEVTMTFDLSNSYHAAQPLDRIYFNMWAPTAAAPGGTYINASKVDGVSTHILSFSEVRSCKRITVTFDLSAVTNKTAVMFYLNVSCGYNNSNVFYFQVDNISILEKAPTACIVTEKAPTPVFHNMGGTQQIVFDNARYNSDKPVFRISHYGAVAATSYQVEINTKEDFTGTSVVQTFNGNYPGQTQANFTFSNAEGLLTDLTTYYIRARIDIGSGYGSWSSKLHSYTYDTGKPVPGWFQTTAPQFLTDELIGTQTMSHYTTVVTPAASGGNVIQNGTFASTSGWTTYKTSGTGALIDVSSTDCFNCPSGTGRNLKFYIFGGQALSGDICVVSQQIDLTGIDVLSLNLSGYYSGHAVGQGVVSNFRVMVGGTSSNDAGTALYTMSQPNCGTYCIASNSQGLNLDVSAYSGMQTIKFVWKFTGTFYDTGLTAFYINNVSTSSVPPTPSGIIISTPVRLASVQGAVGYKELVWNQDLSGGSMTFYLQRYNTVSSLWETVNGFGGIQDPAGNGERSFDLQSLGFPAYDSIRVVGHLSGTTGAVRLNDWAIFFTHPQAPLPVTLTSFTAACEKTVQLSWSTASEQSSDVFILEKSRNLVDWIFVADRKAAGSSSTTKSYAVTDEDPWHEIAYYRLRQLDLNGKESVYGPVSVSCNIGESALTVYPNPNQGDFTIAISSMENIHNAQLMLTDLTGKIVASRSVSITAGATQVFLQGLDLQTGTYLLRLHGSDQFRPVKLIVNR